jgi:DNA-binding NtrC family response regulator
MSCWHRNGCASSNMSQVLIVDDKPAFCDTTAQAFRRAGHDVSLANTLEAARIGLASRVPDLLVLDIMLPDGTGLDLLAELDDAPGTMPAQIAMLTGHDAVKRIITSICGPSVSYFTKPLNGESMATLLQTADALDADAAAAWDCPMVGESAAVRALRTRITQVAPVNATVLICGESGTGKELVAEAIHHQSRRPGPFVPVNCGALTRELIASELFGHERGSFTGAHRQHRGFFEQADGGTLFLDEITEMPAEMQVHLLRVLENRRVQRVGGMEEVNVDVRLIAATNRDPRAAVAAGKLREDLYFRLRVIPMDVPTLRERGRDILLLAEHFLAQLNERYDTHCRLSPDLADRLLAHHWPGNVRELKHAVHRLYVTADGDELDGPVEVVRARGTLGEVSVGMSIREMERELILCTLNHFRGDRRETAGVLGVSVKTLYNRLREYGQGRELREPERL